MLTILAWSIVFDTPMYLILNPYLDFKGVKNIYVLNHDLGLWRKLEVPDLGLES